MVVSKWVSSALALVLLLGNISSTLAESAKFKDVSESTAYDDAITYIKDKGIVSGFGDDTFRPENTVTRAELLKMVLLSDNEQIAVEDTQPCFSDVDPMMWYNKYICYAQDHNIINGYPDGSFKPNQPVSYKEALKISMNTLDERPEETTPLWYQAYEDKAKKARIAVPNAEENNKFERAEMAELLARTLQKKAGQTLNLGAPKIFNPLANEIIVNYPREAKLAWSSVSGADIYEIEITCDYCVSIEPMWQGPSYYKTIDTSFMTPPLAGDNQFRIRVRAKSFQGQEGPWSEFRYFRFDTRSYIDTTPASVATFTAPKITSPSASQVLTQYPRLTKISWTPVDGAYKYEVEMACDMCVNANNLWLNPTSTTTQATNVVTNDLDSDNQFRIRVRAIGEVGQQGPWSDYRYFSYNTRG